MAPEMDWGKSLYGSRPRAAKPALVDGGALVGRVLGEPGVRYLFAINGGHIWPILAHLREHGIKLIHMRHEQACAYAADAYARTSGDARRVQRDRRLRADQRRHRPLRRRADRQRGGLHRRPASRRPRTASARSRRPTAPRSAARSPSSRSASLDWIDDRVRPAPGVPRGAWRRRRASALRRDPDQHPLPPGRRRRAAPRRARSTTPTSCASQADPRAIERAVELLRARRAAADRRPATASSGPTPRPSCASWPS